MLFLFSTGPYFDYVHIFLYDHIIIWSSNIIIIEIIISSSNVSTIIFDFIYQYI